MLYRFSIPLFALLLACLASCQFLPGKQKLRIGTNDSKPFNYFDEQGRPAGFAVDTIRRAAEIAGYEVEWVRSSVGPEATFAAAIADFWPFVTEFEDRRKLMHLTEPWWRIGTILYFPESKGIHSIEDLRGKSLAITSPQRRFSPKVFFPHTKEIAVFETPEAAFEQMCIGNADAALIDYRATDGVLLNRPAGCPSLKLGSLLIDETSRSFAIGARFGFEVPADRLRMAIDTMAESGEIIDIATRWKLLHRTDSAAILWLNRSREKNILLQRMFWGMIVLLAIVLIFAQRLIYARKQAELSARARSQFLANMSHEIRTPMNGILGMTELTLESNLSTEQREHLSMARNSARGLLEILDDILDFSRIESGKLALESIPFDLVETAKRSVQILQLAAESKHIELNFTSDPKLPPALAGDPGRIQQVLINLLGNAVKFTQAGFVRLELKAEPLPYQRCRVHFAVSDSGIGITPEQQKRIFDAFTQADSTTTRKFGGTGLGLSISSQLVKMMGGALTVESRQGAGSTFRFALEFAETSPVTTPAQPGLILPTRSLRVLVAEDNEVNRVLIQRVLDKGGHRVTSVTNGVEALAALETGTYDVVLMDVHMPEMDGLEATRQWRQREASRGGHLPVIALTALAIKGDAERCLEAGMDAYLPKPLNRADLFAQLAQVEAGQKLLEQAAVAPPPKTSAPVL